MTVYKVWGRFHRPSTGSWLTVMFGTHLSEQRPYELLGEYYDRLRFSGWELVAITQHCPDNPVY